MSMRVRPASMVRCTTLLRERLLGAKMLNRRNDVPSVHTPPTFYRRTLPNSVYAAGTLMRRTTPRGAAAARASVANSILPTGASCASLIRCAFQADFVGGVIVETLCPMLARYLSSYLYVLASRYAWKDKRDTLRPAGKLV